MDRWCYINVSVRVRDGDRSNGSANIDAMDGVAICINIADRLRVCRGGGGSIYRNYPISW